MSGFSLIPVTFPHVVLVCEAVGDTQEMLDGLEFLEKKKKTIVVYYIFLGCPDTTSLLVTIGLADRAWTSGRKQIKQQSFLTSPIALSSRLALRLLCFLLVPLLYVYGVIIDQTHGRTCFLHKQPAPFFLFLV